MSAQPPQPPLAYNPNPSPAPSPVEPPVPPVVDLLSALAGTWSGKGFNSIWRPNQLSIGQDRFLELSLTEETWEFIPIPGLIPNRGLLQGDINMTGLRYLQQVSDANFAPPDNALHIEPGVFLNIPATTDPPVSASIARLGSIPHGTTILAQGVASQAAGPPQIPSVSLDPFSIGQPGSPSTFPEQNLQTTTNFRTSGQGLTGISQPMLDNPNSVLTALVPSDVESTTTLQLSSSDLPVPGGGTDNTAFLIGGANGPNASAVSVAATFWLEQLASASGAPQMQLQYSQTVILNFNGISWPHVSVATLTPSQATS